MVIAELFARIGIKADSSQLKGLRSALSTVKTGLFAVTAAAAGVSAVITKVTRDALLLSTGFTQFEAETGASAQTLQKWRAVAEQVGASADSVNGSIKAMADNQAQIQLGKGNISGYQWLGIDPREDPFKVLEKLRERTRGMSESMRKH